MPDDDTDRLVELLVLAFTVTPPVSDQDLKAYPEQEGADTE